MKNFNALFNEVLELSAENSKNYEKSVKIAESFLKSKHAEKYLPQPMSKLESLIKEMDFTKAFKSISASKNYGGSWGFNLRSKYFAISGLKEDDEQLVSFESEDSLLDYLFRLFYDFGGKESMFR